MTQLKKNHTLHVLLLIILTALLIAPISTALMITSDTYTNPHAPLNGPNTIYVDDDNTQGPWDGTLNHPYQFIQDGINHANDGDTVYVFNGSYTEHIVVFKSLHLTGEHQQETIIDGEQQGTVVLLTANNIHLSGFTIAHSGTNQENAGILILSLNNIIHNNIISENKYGIYAVAPNNHLYHNTFIFNTIHAYDEAANVWDNNYPDGGNYWSEYTLPDDDEDGIVDVAYPIMGNTSTDRYPLVHIYGSIINMNTSEIFLCIQQAIHDSDTTTNHIIMVKNDRYPEHICINKAIHLCGETTTDTTIDGRTDGTVVKIVCNQVRISGFTITNSGVSETNAGILIDAVDQIRIFENIIESNYHGIMLKCGSNDNEIQRNILRNNQWNGLYIKSSKTNTILENTFVNNGYAGVFLTDSSYNTLYHNNFMNNLHQAADDSSNLWDDDYPSGGNYWDDYTGVDLDGDGIGDTTYFISGGINKDRYPLMNPYGTGDITPPTVTILSPQHGLYLRNRRLFQSIIRNKIISIGDLTFEVEATDPSGIRYVQFYIDNTQYPEATDYYAPYTWTWKNNPGLRHKHTIYIITRDTADNTDITALTIRKYF